MIRSLKEHWPEYSAELLLTAVFLAVACLVFYFLKYPASPVVALLPSPFVRQLIIGVILCAASIGLVFSPLGQRSGAHLNPAITLTFLRLGKVKAWDAFFYVCAQFVGGVLGVAAMARLLPGMLGSETIKLVATTPGPTGEWAAFIAEFIIAFVLMLTLLVVNNTPHVARWTAFFAGVLSAIYIIFEAPISGASANPAASFGPELVGQLWQGWWIYLTAPVLAMQLAAICFRASGRRIYCAKIHHYNGERCIFNCEFPALLEREKSGKK
jgi:aquaporin Z